MRWARDSAIPRAWHRQRDPSSSTRTPTHDLHDLDSLAARTSLPIDTFPLPVLVYVPIHRARGAGNVHVYDDVLRARGTCAELTPVCSSASLSRRDGRETPRIEGDTCSRSRRSISRTRLPTSVPPCHMPNLEHLQSRPAQRNGHGAKKTSHSPWRRLIRACYMHQGGLQVSSRQISAFAMLF